MLKVILNSLVWDVVTFHARAVNDHYIPVNRSETFDCFGVLPRKACHWQHRRRFRKAALWQCSEHTLNQFNPSLNSLPRSKAFKYHHMFGGSMQHLPVRSVLGTDNLSASSKVMHTNAPIFCSAAVSILQEIAKETSGPLAQDEGLISMVDALRRICKKDYISSHSTPKFDTSAQGNKE